MTTSKVPSVPTETVSLVVNKLFGPTVRAVIYVLLFVIGVVLLVWGKISSGQLSEWLLFAGTILGVGSSGLAVANRPQKIQSRPELISPDAHQEMEP